MIPLPALGAVPWKLVGTIGAVLAAAIYIAILKADVSHWRDIADDRAARITTLQTAAALQNAAIAKTAEDGRQRVAANDAAIDATRPAIAALRASAASLRAAAGQRVTDCTVPDVAVRAWQGL